MNSAFVQNVAEGALLKKAPEGGFSFKVSTATETAAVEFPVVVVSASLETHELGRRNVSKSELIATLYVRSPDFARAEVETLVSEVDSALAEAWTKDVFSELRSDVCFHSVAQDSFEEPRCESENLIFTWRFAVVSQFV